MFLATVPATSPALSSPVTPRGKKIHIHTRHFCAKAVGQADAMVPTPRLAHWRGSRELGALGVGDRRTWVEGPWGGAEDTAAGAPCSPLPSGLPKCCYLFLPRSSLPLIFRGYFYSSFWSQLRLCLITSSRKAILPSQIEVCLSGTSTWYSNCLLTICFPGPSAPQPLSSPEVHHCTAPGPTPRARQMNVVEYMND